MGARSSVAFMLAVTCAAWLLTGSAWAYSDPFRFVDTTESGGGAGRFFTGSTADGYGCEVCHEGAPLDQLVVQGLPPQYMLGASYDIQVSWPAVMQKVTALVELTDDLGRGAGRVELAPPLSVAENCEPVAGGVPAAIVLEGDSFQLANGRQIVAMQDCGASLLHWRWTAPSVDVGPVYFTGGVVWPDQRVNAFGDRTSALFLPMTAVTQPAYTSTLVAGCSIARAAPRSSRAHGPGTIAMPLGLLFALRLARAYRRSRSTQSHRLRAHRLRAHCLRAHCLRAHCLRAHRLRARCMQPAARPLAPRHLGRRSVAPTAAAPVRRT
jgi:hypothetical protein